MVPFEESQDLMFFTPVFCGHAKSTYHQTTSPELFWPQMTEAGVRVPRQVTRTLQAASTGLEAGFGVSVRADPRPSDCCVKPRTERVCGGLPGLLLDQRSGFKLVAIATGQHKLGASTHCKSSKTRHFRQVPWISNKGTIRARERAKAELEALRG